MPKAAKAKPEKATRKKKDPNAPKRPLAPYMFFCKENREIIKEQNPDVTFGELGKLLGAQWAQLDEKSKKPYVKMSEADKRRYEDEVAQYGGGDE